MNRKIKSIKYVLSFLTFIMVFGVSIFAKAQTATENTRIAGDVYSGSGIINTGDKLFFDQKSVVSANGVINSSGQNWTIPNYNSVLWSLAQARMPKIINRLKTNAKVLLVNKISGIYDINSSGIAEGQVWKHTGNLTIGDPSVDTVFNGNGTIIVDGKVTIDGNIISNKPVGIIANNGDIDINQSVIKILKTYFYTNQNLNFK